MAGSVDHDPPAVLADRPMCNRVREVLERVDHLPVTTDQHAEVGPGHRREHLVAVVLDTHRGVETQRADDALEQSPGDRVLTLVDAGRAGRRRRRTVDCREHARGRVADAGSPRSPSLTTWKRTPSRSIPGASRSSSRSAAHFASPTVSPVASTETSSLTVCGPLRSACA